MLQISFPWNGVSVPETGCGVRLGGWASVITMLYVKAKDQVDLLNVTLMIRGGKILDLPSSVSYLLTMYLWAELLSPLIYSTPVCKGGV